MLVQGGACSKDCQAMVLKHLTLSQEEHGAPAGTRTPIDGLGNRNGHLRNLLVIRQTIAKQHVIKSDNVQRSANFGKKVHDFCHANDTQHVAALKLFGSYK